jgi:hypothetical protein
MKDGQVMVLLLLDFSQAFDMVVHGLLLCKLQNSQNYSIGAGLLVGSNLGKRAPILRSGGQEFSVGALDDVSRVVVFTFMRLICRFITLALCQTFKGVLMS